MTKISTYPIDTDVTGSDKWIGTDSDTYNATKNFTPVKLAKFFNNSEIISIGTNLRYVYDILEVGEPRNYGTITFDPQQGSSVPFSGITTFILSKFTIGGKDVEDYITKLDGSQIVICNSDNPNSFGVFDITSVTQIILEPNFYTVTLDFVDGYGNLIEDKSYAFQLIRFGQDTPDGVQSVTGNIVDNTDPLNPIVTQVQSDWNASSGLGEILNKPTIPNPDLQEVLNNGNTVSDDTPIFYSDNGIASTSYNNGDASFLNTSNNDITSYGISGIRRQKSDLTKYTEVNFINPTSANGISFQDGSGTLAFLSDIPSYTTPSLQDVTDVGAITTNTITVGSLSGNYSQVLNTAIGTANDLTGTYAYLDNTGQLGLHNGTVESDLRNTNVANVGVVLEFPNKPTGSYTIATISDIPTNVGFEQNFLLMGA